MLSVVVYRALTTRARLSYDAAVAKLEKLKTAKKVQDKDREEAQEEYESTKSR